MEGVLMCPRFTHRAVITPPNPLVGREIAIFFDTKGMDIYFANVSECTVYTTTTCSSLT
jgi:hypothetical protein